VICIPVVAKTKEQILEEMQRAAKAGVSMIEWRIDFYEDIQNVKKVTELLREIRAQIGQCVLLVTCRTKAEGGNADLDGTAYETLLCEIAAADDGTCADVFDVEYERCANPQNVVSKLKGYHIQTVISYHDFSQTPKTDEMIKRLLTMAESRAMFVKMAVMPKEKDDVTRLIQATATAKNTFPPQFFITMSMGELGKVSRTSGEKFGSCVTFGCLSQASAPGQIEYETLKEELFLTHQKVLEEADKKHLYLIGFMGTGKSTMMRMLHEKTGLAMIDTDEFIEQLSGRKIRDIFAEDGEEAFRRMETDCLRRITTCEASIISCGGGIVLREENIRLMKKSGVIVCLEATAETVWNRVHHSDSRPVLNGNMNVEYIQSLLDARRPYYEEAAECHVPTDSRTKEEICKDILEQYRSLNHVRELRSNGAVRDLI
jgi:3-dehydroquinate dehydratase type I